MEDIEVKTRIQEAARELIMQYSVRSVSMDDIATSLGISKKTIYHCFKDKEELIDTVLSGTFENNRSYCNKVMTEAENAVHEIFLALESHVEMFKTMNPAILFDMQKYHPRVFSKFSEFKNHFLYQVIQNNLKRGIEEGLYRKDIRVDVLAKLRVEVIFLPFTPEFRKGFNESFYDLHEEIILHFLFGVVNEKGYALAMQYLHRYKENNTVNK